MALLLTVVTAGCSRAEAPRGQPAGDAGAERTAASRVPGGAKVLQPGRPGQPARTLPPDATVEQPGWNSADVRFLQMMVPHHAQALRMCGLARSRADDAQVSALARRISGAQGPEILAMSAWLQEHGLEAPSGMRSPSGHDHGGHHAHGGQGSPAATMPGMLSPTQMRELAGAYGPRFDRLFLAAMIRHHQGAVTMADRVLTHGSDLRVAEIAADVSVEQKAEINRMRAIQRGL
ncbi:MAG: DUF305 domain-containing protein [Actinomycetota bacterium]|nr:DUF305 domain-containing protein [Actinomycetota bacterium]